MLTKINPGYDIIGDIHGHSNDLIQLLHYLNYYDSTGVFIHPTRKAIFLGDFIDRGINQKNVLDIVMPMVESDSAYAVMGNHEFNALSFHTIDPDKPSDWLRKHDDKNIHQHSAFLEDYDRHDQNELQQALSFFKSLPLWIELDGIRIIHACWHDDQIAAIRPLLAENNTITDDFLIAANRKDSIEFNAIETLLKGVEIQLPNQLSFQDKDGNTRTRVRVQWWLNQAKYLGEIVLGGYDSSITDIEIDQTTILGYPDNAKPVFIGHYWLNGEPAPLADNVACVDYSVAKNGKLVAYRWDGETILKKDHYQFVT